MIPLYNEKETYTKEGSDIFSDFADLIHPFIKDKIQKHNSIELNQILSDAMDYIVTLERTKKSLNERIL
jgi:hypothetical protein